jgi:hypothetical protein
MSDFGGYADLEPALTSRLLVTQTCRVADAQRRVARSLNAGSAHRKQRGTSTEHCEPIDAALPILSRLLEAALRASDGCDM